MIDNPIIIATRQSELALWQAEFIGNAIENAWPGVEVKLLGMTTRGDRWLNAPLAEIGGKGLFIKELEGALLAGDAHIAVHSMKDVPAVLPEGFSLPVMAFRDDPRDVLVSRNGETLAELPAGSRVGSSSLRRQSQVYAVRRDLDVCPVRGNVNTRLDKLDSGEYDALLLAAAGLKRLQLEARITEYLDINICLPAGGQGALGIECRADDEALMELLSPLDDGDVRACVVAERGVSAGLGADCSAPLGAHATILDGRITLRAVLANPNGDEVLRASASGTRPDVVAANVVANLDDQGGLELLQRLKLLEH